MASSLSPVKAVGRAGRDIVGVAVRAGRLVRRCVLAQVGRGSSGLAAGRVASSDRVSSEAGFGRSCAWLVGGHTPLQVALCATWERTIRG